MNEKGERLMFGLFHKKEQKALELGAPVSGQAVPLQEVSDPTFGGEILGKGVAVRPTDGRIYAPADGEITLLFDTLHALSMTTDTGAELLLHIGLDTVALRSYDEISSEVGKSIDASGCLPADLRYLNGNRICTLPGNHAGW